MFWPIPRSAFVQLVERNVTGSFTIDFVLSDSLVRICEHLQYRLETFSTPISYNSPVIHRWVNHVSLQYRSINWVHILALQHELVSVGTFEPPAFRLEGDIPRPLIGAVRTSTWKLVPSTSKASRSPFSQGQQMCFIQTQVLLLVLLLLFLLYVFIT